MGLFNFFKKRTNNFKSIQELERFERKYSLLQLHIMAKKGDANAQCILGGNYYSRNTEEAKASIAWLQKSAKQGHPIAQHWLASAFANGNFKKAFKWLQKSAEQGYASAQYALGALYLSGKGVPQNDVEAKRWYQAAAEQGHSDAIIALQMMSKL